MTTEPDLRTPDEWQQEMPDVVIYDPDGWRGANGRPWTDPISRDEYLERRAACTVGPPFGASEQHRRDIAYAHRGEVVPASGVPVEPHELPTAWAAAGEQGDDEFAAPPMTGKLTRADVELAAWATGYHGPEVPSRFEEEDEDGAGYIRLDPNPHPIAATLDLGNGLHLDVDGDQRAVGIEYLNGRDNALRALLRLLGTITVVDEDALPDEAPNLERAAARLRERRGATGRPLTPDEGDLR